MSNVKIFRTKEDQSIDEDCQKLWDYIVDNFTPGHGEETEADQVAHVFAMIWAMERALEGCCKSHDLPIIKHKARAIERRQKARVRI